MLISFNSSIVACMPSSNMGGASLTSSPTSWFVVTIVRLFTVKTSPVFTSQMVLRFIQDGMELRISFESWPAINMSIAPQGRKFVLPFCFHFAFKSFESREWIEWLSLVRTEPWVLTWEGVEWLSLVKIKPWVPTIELSSCVPNLSKTEIHEVGRPMQWKIDDFFDRFKDCFSSS